MILNDKGSVIRANEKDIEDIGIITHYEGKPLTGIAYSLFDNGNIRSEYEMVNGLKDGVGLQYDFAGNISEKRKFKLDFIYEKIRLNKDGKTITESYYDKGEFTKANHYDDYGNEIEGFEWFDSTILGSYVKVRKFGVNGIQSFSSRLIWLRPKFAGFFNHLWVTIRFGVKNLKSYEMGIDSELEYKNPDTIKYLNDLILKFKTNFPFEHNQIFYDNSVDDIRELLQYKMLISPSYISEIVPEGTAHSQLFSHTYLKTLQGQSKDFKKWIVVDNSINPAGIVFQSDSKPDCQNWIESWDFLKKNKDIKNNDGLEAYKVLFADLEDNNIESSNSNNEPNHYQIACDYGKSGEYKLAIEHYTKSIEKDPNHVDSYVNRGRIYDEVTGQLQLAIDDYTKAINIDSNDAITYYNRGIVFFKLKRYDNGIKDFTKSIEIDPNFASAYKNRGLAKEKAGMDPCSDWKKACSLGIEECCIYYEEDKCGDINNQNKSELRVAFNESEFIEGVTHYKGKPLAGIVYSLHDNGELKEEIRMIAGYRNGLQETWNENGQLIFCINFKGGIPCGISKTYYDTGELKSETNFIEFVPNSVTGSANELLNQLNIKNSHIIVKNYRKNGELKDKVETKYGEVIKS